MVHECMVRMFQWMVKCIYEPHVPVNVPCIYGTHVSVNGSCIYGTHVSEDLTRFNKIATQGAPQMAVDKEANSLSRVYSYYSKFNLRLFYV